MKESKSVLDGVPVVDTAFPLRLHNPPPLDMDIVGSCPKCGSPIYGYKRVAVGAIAPVKYSCTCRVTSIEDTVRIT